MSQLKKAPSNLAYLGGSVIVAVIALAVFISSANAGDCPRSKSAEATSKEAHQKTDDKTEIKA